MSGFWLQVYLAVINSNKISPPMASSCLQSIECIVSKTCSFFKYCNNPRNIKFEWTTFPVVFFETKYSRVDQTKFVEDSPKKLEVILCLNKPYHLEFFKGCLPQILPGPLLNTLSPFTQPMQNSEYADKVKYNSKMLHLGIKNDEHKKEWKVTQSCQVKLD